MPETNENRRRRYATDTAYRARVLARNAVSRSASEKRSEAVSAVKRWRLENPERATRTRRSYELRRKFNITLDAYERMFEEQRGCCAICKKEERIAGAFGRRLLAVDHDHRTGKIRGLLCAACNTTLGKFGDSPLLLLEAALYLERCRG